MTHFAPRALVLPVCLIAASIAVASCGGSSPTSPASSTPSVTPTRIIDVTGNLAFGTVNIGQSSARTFTISNSGNSPLTFTGMTAQGGTGTAGYAASPTTGTIAAGGSQQVTITFTPTAEKFYSNVLTVNGDQTSGNNAINVSGTGFNANPIYSKSGVGDSVFDIPTYVTRLRITAAPASSCQNFVVRVAGKLIVNVILGTCSVADSRMHDGTYAITAGGTAEITISSGVSWTVTEVR